VLADAAPGRAGEEARLQRRDPDLAVELGTPRLLVGRNQKPQAAVGELVSRYGAFSGAPVREVVRIQRLGSRGEPSNVSSNSSSYGMPEQSGAAGGSA
jgi:hypothetical protein